jgi:hypothetical protein
VEASLKKICFLNMYLRTTTPVGQKDGSFSSSLNLNRAPTLKQGKVLFVVGIFSQLNLVFWYLLLQILEDNFFGGIWRCFGNKKPYFFICSLKIVVFDGFLTYHGLFSVMVFLVVQVVCFFRLLSSSFFGCY